MSNVWFTSDTHFNHPKVAATRGYATPEQHDEALVDEWNALVRPGDHVWHLGDVGMGSPSVFFPIVQLLNGAIHLVAGNHDQVWPGNRDAYKHQSSWLQFFGSVQPFARRKVAGRNVLLCHLPYQGDHTSVDRYPEYRLRDTRMPLLCGHVHAEWKVRHTESGTLQINMGVDVWGLRPVSLDEVAQVVKERS